MILQELDRLLQENKFEAALVLIDSEVPADQKLKITLEVYRLEIFQRLGQYDLIFTSIMDLIESAKESDMYSDLLKLYSIKISSGMKINRIKNINQIILEGRELYTKLNGTSVRELSLKAEFLSHTAIYEVFQGQHSAAVEDFSASLQIRESLGDKSKVYSTNNNLALAYLHNGELEKAKELFQKCLMYFNSQNEEYKSALTLHNIAQINMREGLILDALKEFNIGLNLFRKLGDKQAIAKTQLSIGSVLTELNEIDSAILAIEESRFINEALLNQIELANIYHNLGDLYRIKKEFKKSLELYDSSLIISLNSFHLLAAYSLLDKIEVLLTLEKKNQALETHSKFLLLTQDGDNKIILTLKEISWALILSSGGSLSEIVQAQEILKVYYGSSDFDYYIYVKVVLELISLIIYEYRISKKDELILGIADKIENLLDFTERNKLHLTRCHILLIASKIALIRSNFTESRRYIEEAYKLGERHGSLKLSWLITNYYDDFLVSISQFNQDSESNSQISLAQLSSIEDLIYEGRKKYVISMNIEVEIPLFFLIFDRKTKAILFYLELSDSKHYEQQFAENIVTQISDFYHEITEKWTTERIHINNHTALFQFHLNLGFVYLFKGRSFTANHKLNSLNSYLLSFIKADVENYFNKHQSDIRNVCMMVLAKSYNDDDLNNMIPKAELTANLPDEVNNFRSILHPIRLSIISLLYRQFQIPRNDILKILAINSGSLSNHIKLMLEENLLNERTDFIENKAKKVIFIEPRGLQMYKMFRDWTNQL